MTPYYDRQGIQFYHGDALAVLRELPDCSVNCCVTSPPYWGLRDYGVDGQLGLEKTPEEFVARMVGVFQEVRRVLANDGTCWLNLGDGYASGGSGFFKETDKQRSNAGTLDGPLRSMNRITGGLKPKDLVGVPWSVAFGLRDDGWYLRQDCIWDKPNPMPESVNDRCTKSHEYLFLLSKSQRYHFDQDAILEPCSPNTHARISQKLANQIGSERANGGTKTNGNMKAVVRGSGRKLAESGSGIKNNESFAESVVLQVDNRNKRSVWTVATKPYAKAHFATFPPKLIEPCILAGCPEGGTVLDPFIGSGTTAMVSQDLGRKCIGIDLNCEYLELAKERLQQGVLF